MQFILFYFILYIIFNICLVGINKVWYYKEKETLEGFELDRVYLTSYDFETKDVEGTLPFMLLCNTMFPIMVIFYITLLLLKFSDIFVIIHKLINYKEKKEDIKNKLLTEQHVLVKQLIQTDIFDNESPIIKELEKLQIKLNS